MSWRSNILLSQTVSQWRKQDFFVKTKTLMQLTAEQNARADGGDKSGTKANFVKVWEWS